MHPRYHYWTYRVTGTERQLINRRGSVIKNEMADAVLDALAEILPFTHFGERMVTIAEDMDLGYWDLAIQHPRDTFSKRLGRTISLGRLKLHARL